MAAKIDMGSRSIPFKVYMAVILFAALGTVASRFLGPPPSWIPTITSVLMLTLGAFLVLRELTPKSGFALFAIGLAAELCGVSTGLPFGNYRYTSAWAPVIELPNGRLFPILVPLAWCLMAGGSFLTLPKSKFRVLGAGVLAALLDLGMEYPMTQKLHYWEWTGRTTPPAMNFLGWVLTSTLGCLFLSEQDVQDQEGPLALFAFMVFVLLQRLVR